MQLVVPGSGRLNGTIGPGLRACVCVTSLARRWRESVSGLVDSDCVLRLLG